MKPPITIEQQPNGKYRINSAGRCVFGRYGYEVSYFIAAYVQSHDGRVLDGETFESAAYSAAIESGGLLQCPVGELDIGVRSFNCLTRAGILTLGDLCCRTRKELLRIKNFGLRSLREVESALVDYRLSLKDVSPQHNPAQSATTPEPCDGSHPDDSEDD